MCLQTTSLGYQGHTFKLVREDETRLFLSRITQSYLAHIAYSRTQLLFRFEVANMEQRKSRTSVFLVFAVLVNFAMSFVIVGFVVYKAKVLEKEIVHLQTKLSEIEQFEHRGGDGEDFIQRSKRSSKNRAESKTCASCHSACVKLFGLGSDAKVGRVATMS